MPLGFGRVLHLGSTPSRYHRLDVGDFGWMPDFRYHRNNTQLKATLELSPEGINEIGGKCVNACRQRVSP
jgi:hypothetical protein